MRPLPDKFLAAMIAALPLPGSPRYGGDPERILDQALDDLRHYVDAGVDSVLLENSHDLPYIKPPPPVEAVEVMTRVARAVRDRFDGPVGIQMLEAANEAALDIAARADLDFVRGEGYGFAHVGGAGIIEGCAGALHRRRAALGCDHVRFYADVKKKHCAHALTGDLDIVDEARQAAFFLADGVVVTGPRTGTPPDVEEMTRIKAATRLPVVVGSGMTPENLPAYFPHADGFIVGSTFRREGEFLERLDRARLDRFMEVFRTLRAP